MKNNSREVYVAYHRTHRLTGKPQNKVASKKGRASSVFAVLTFIAFVAFTVALKFVDVASVGPNDSVVGLASFNVMARERIGTCSKYYQASELLGKAVIAFVALFALLGLGQLIKRRSFKKVDSSLYSFAIMLVVLAVFYVAFEKVVINYRPVLEDGALVASYPSSHTMLAVCIMGASAHQFGSRIKSAFPRFFIVFVCVAVMVATVFSRMMSGVHWATDIIGGILLATSLLLSYLSRCAKRAKKA